MIIWRDAGLTVLIIQAIAFWLSGYLFEPDLKKSKLRLGVGLIMGGAFLLLTLWKKKQNDKKIFNSGDEEKKAFEKFYPYSQFYIRHDKNAATFFKINNQWFLHYQPMP